jgi:hypothetical protein
MVDQHWFFGQIITLYIILHSKDQIMFFNLICHPPIKQSKTKINFIILKHLHLVFILQSLNWEDPHELVMTLSFATSCVQVTTTFHVARPLVAKP